MLAMSTFVSPQIFLVSLLAGWLNQEQQKILEYLQEENRVLKVQRGQRLCLSDEQCRRLSAKGKELGLRGKRLRLSDDDRRRLADHVSQHIATLQRSLPTSLLLVPSLVRIGKRAKTQYRYSLSDSRQSSG